MSGYTSPPLPVDEAERLGALRAAQLLDSEPEELFDRVTRIACDTLQVPISLISLVDDDRQWFKASCGLAAKETGRDISFCGHAILSDEPLVVADALADERFAGNPLVTGEPHIRFYAGVPIHAGHHRIGTLCVIDQVPRDLFAQEIGLLRSLARMIEDLLYLRQAALDSVRLLNAWEPGATPSLQHIQQLKDRISRDALTGLPNRDAIEHEIRQRQGHWQAHGARAILALIDIDNLQAVNERAGHRTGDIAVSEIARRLVAQLHPGDVAARINGGTFALLTTELPSIEQGADRLATMHRELNRLITADTVLLHGSVTMGYVLVHEVESSSESLLSAAGAAVRQANVLGHGLMRQFSASAKCFDYRTLEHDLRGAISNHELFMLYQAKTDVRTGLVTGFEALIRWDHPTLGMVSPAQFIPIAEESAVIVQIGQWTLEQACRQARQWRCAGHTSVPIAVNLSSRQFLHGDIVREVRAALEAHDLPGEALELELTETVALYDVRRAVDIMRQLKALGVLLSVDDFGTGYSSLSYLKLLPVDKLKIDRSFIIDLGESHSSRSIVNAILGMATGIEVGVIAEGVETAAQVDILASLGCMEMQGYYFSRPVSAEAAGSLLASVH